MRARRVTRAHLPRRRPARWPLPPRRRKTTTPSPEYSRSQTNQMDTSQSRIPNKSERTSWAPFVCSLGWNAPVLALYPLIRPRSPIIDRLHGQEGRVQVLRTSPWLSWSYRLKLTIASAASPAEVLRVLPPAMYTVPQPLPRRSVYVPRHTRWWSSRLVHEHPEMLPIQPVRARTPRRRAGL